MVPEFVLHLPVLHDELERPSEGELRGAVKKSF